MINVEIQCNVVLKSLVLKVVPQPIMDPICSMQTKEIDLINIYQRRQPIVIVNNIYYNQLLCKSHTFPYYYQK